MSAFKPNWRKADDFPSGYNDLSMDAKRAISHERLRLLHIYAQSHPHGDAQIIGNRCALVVLRDAISAAIATGPDAKTTAMTADGEGFEVHIILDDTAWDGPKWQAREMPYCDDTP